MKLFFIILFLAVCPLSIGAQTAIEYDAKEYDCTEYEAVCEEKEVTEIRIFPNPTSDYFEVKGAENTEGYLFDLQGRLIRRFLTNEKVDISDLPCAPYIIRINFKHSKIIKIQ